MVPILKNGLPELGIPSIDPLEVKSMTISQGQNSPINLKQEFKNIKLLHLSTSVVKKYYTDFTKWRLKSISYTPVMEFLGEYNMDGRVLILPVVGKGKSNITMIDLKTTHELFGEPYMKDGEAYLKIKDYKIILEPKRVVLHFTNLFNGQKTLSDNLHSFINENWKVVFDELKGGYEESFARVFQDVANRLFSQIPIDKIFLE